MAAVAAAVLALGVMPVVAQKHKGGRGGHSETSHTDHLNPSHESGSEHKSGRGRRGSASRGRSVESGGSLRDIFRSMEDDTHRSHSTSETSRTDAGHASSGKRGQSANSEKGKRGNSGRNATTRTLDTMATKGARGASGREKSGKAGTREVSEDSDRPAWAGVPGRDGKPGRGSPTPGTKKGDLYGDMYVILRDANGVPVLKQLADGTWVVQPIGVDGQPLPFDAEGNLINPELALEVELGRLNVGRSPESVLAARYAEAVKLINAADTITLDASGRLVLITGGVAKTIDSPLENLALYKEVLKAGTLTGVNVADPSKFAAISYLVNGAHDAADVKAAASFLAAASDKAGSLTIDKVVYLNRILGITGTLTDSIGEGSYIDFSTFAYDRAAAYGNTTVDILLKQPDGSYRAETVNVYTALFKGVPYISASGVDGFAQSADDARAIIEFVHDNAIPESQ